MRFAITLTDRYLGIAEAFIARGWTLHRVFSTPVDGLINHHQATLAFAAAHGVPSQLTPITPADLAGLGAAGCEALIVASYDRRLPPWREHLRYAINFHPSPLPLGRGPYPQVAALLQGARSWGISCHIVETDFDSGPLLARREFALTDEDCHETLDFRLQLAGQALAAEVAANFTALWKQASPQGPGSYFPLWREVDRLLDFGQPLANLQRQLRAFGRIECLALINGIPIRVRHAVGWREVHGHAPGTLVRHHAQQLLLAVADGYLVVVDWQLVAPPGTPAGDA